jgi:hypothetical protein
LTCPLDGGADIDIGEVGQDRGREVRCQRPAGGVAGSRRFRIVEGID